MVIIIKLDSISIVTVIMWRKNQYIYIRDGISIVIVIMWREKNQYIYIRNDKSIVTKCRKKSVYLYQRWQINIYSYNVEKKISIFISDMTIQ